MSESNQEGYQTLQWIINKSERGLFLVVADEAMQEEILQVYRNGMVGIYDYRKNPGAYSFQKLQEMGILNLINGVRGTILRAIFFVLIGYLSGSVLYACVFAKLFKKNDFIEMSRDKNPGTANAFRYGGFWCGSFTLVFDLLKGLVPVSLYMTYVKQEPGDSLFFALVMAAPVIGHAFPLFYCFQGGKGIAVTFGCLCGLFPFWQPLVSLAVSFIFFSTVFRITPHYYRTLIAYLCSLISLFFVADRKAIRVGFLIISAVVIIKLLISKEDKEPMGVKLLWMH